MQKTFTQFISLLTEMPLPVAVDLPQTTKELTDYKTNLTRLGVLVGKGSSRAVIKVTVDGKEYVLKIAINNNGLKQNKNEKDIVEKFTTLFTNVHNPLLTLLDDYTHYHSIEGLPVWLQFDIVIPFKKTQYKELNDYFVPIYGDFTKLSNAKQFLENNRPDYKGKKEYGFEFCFLNTFRSQLRSKPASFTLDQWQNLLALYKFIDKSKTSIHDLRIPENWGLTRDTKELKIIDLGFSDEFCKTSKPLRVTNNQGMLKFS